MKSFIDNAMSRTVSVLLFILLASCTSIPEGIKPVTDFNSDNYLGTWYEVARFDHSFERGLENVTATYTRRADGGIDVLNRGFNQTLDEWDEANGKAYFVGEQTVGASESVLFWTVLCELYSHGCGYGGLSVFISNRPFS